MDMSPDRPESSGNPGHFRQLQSKTMASETAISLTSDYMSSGQGPHHTYMDEQPYQAALSRWEHERTRDSSICSEQEVLALLTRFSHEPAERDFVNYSMNTFPWAEKMQEALVHTFHLQCFRDSQSAICNANMDRQNIIAIMPTGGGKSLTYQLPAVLSKGCTIVLSPLKVLMVDQVSYLQRLGVRAAQFSGDNPAEHAMIYYQLANRGSIPKEEQLKLLYMAPEQLHINQKLAAALIHLASLGLLARIVIDEAHGIVHDADFRNAYLSLADFMPRLTNVPLMALSATMTSDILTKIQQAFKLQPFADGFGAIASNSTPVFATATMRSNLVYAVNIAFTSFGALPLCRYIIENYANSQGIIYCATKKNTDKIASKLKELSHEQIQAAPYHADLPAAVRHATFTNWLQNKTHVLVATQACGLGIDKANVRFVIHLEPPPNFIRLMQESGRAGRDEKKARCTVFYWPQDAINISKHLQTEAKIEEAREIIAYCHDLESCRQVLHERSLGLSAALPWLAFEQARKCDICDNCTRSPEEISRQDVTEIAWIILQIFQALKAQARNHRVTLAMLSEDAYRNLTSSNANVLFSLPSIQGQGANRSRLVVQWICIEMLLQGYIREEHLATGAYVHVYLALGPRAPTLLNVTREEAGRLHTRIMVTLPPHRATDSFPALPAGGQDQARHNGSFTSTPSLAAVKDESDIEGIEPVAGPSRSRTQARAHRKGREEDMDLDHEAEVIEISSDSE